MDKSQIPEGWKLVPIEPTEHMLDVLHDRIRIECIPERQEANIKNDREVWQAVLDATPAPSAPDARLARAVSNAPEAVSLDPYLPAPTAPTDGTRHKVPCTANAATICPQPAYCHANGCKTAPTAPSEPKVGAQRCSKHEGYCKSAVACHVYGCVSGQLLR